MVNRLNTRVSQNIPRRLPAINGDPLCTRAALKFRLATLPVLYPRSGRLERAQGLHTSLASGETRFFLGAGCGAYRQENRSPFLSFPLLRCLDKSDLSPSCQDFFSLFSFEDFPFSKTCSHSFEQALIRLPHTRFRFLLRLDSFPTIRLINSLDRRHHVQVCQKLH